jgi:DNA-binding transcriptional MerR regulator
VTVTAPKRLYYKIGEACKLLDIQPYVLRYWETEFPLLAPNKSKSGQRVYSEAELGIIRRIKELLYDEGFTIAGAKKRLEAEMAAGGPAAKPEPEAEAPPAAGPLFAAPRPVAVRHLDTRTEEQIEKLREGVGDALRQAREILKLLETERSR